MRKTFEMTFLAICFAAAAFIWVGIVTENRIFPIGVGGVFSALFIGIGLLPILIKTRSKKE